jgi:uncharacterized protein (TIGR00375 family)
MATRTVYADLHIHTGRAGGRPVKMAAAPTLTVENVIRHAREEKGLDLIVLIDGVCPPVCAEIEELRQRGSLQELPDGGLACENGLVVVLGAEVEVAGPAGGAAHFGCWFGSIQAAKEFAAWLGTVQTNPALSSQRIRADAHALQSRVRECGGLFVVHHAFTPHKGLYGSCVSHLADMVNPDWVDGIELGLSADTWMADCVSELAFYTFLTSSDAHSLSKIAREYNQLQLTHVSFAQLRHAMHRENGCGWTANFGLHPALGKYHRSACANCGIPWPEGQVRCPCGGERMVPGVWDRWLHIRDREHPVHPPHRPPYVHQVPLEFVPGLGPRLRRRLLDAFGTEMAVLHRATLRELCDVVGDTLARRIDAARTGQVRFVAGGAGRYGHIEFDS